MRLRENLSPPVVLKISALRLAESLLRTTRRLNKNYIKTLNNQSTVSLEILSTMRLREGFTAPVVSKISALRLAESPRLLRTTRRLNEN